MNRYTIDYGFGTAQFYTESSDDDQVQREFYECANECFGIRKSISGYILRNTVSGVQLPEEFQGHDATHLLMHSGDTILFDRRFATSDGDGWKIKTEGGSWCTCKVRGVPEQSCDVHEYDVSVETQIVATDLVDMVAQSIYEQQEQPYRLNLGAGHSPLIGYVNIDRMYGVGPIDASLSCVSGDVYPLPYGDNCVDEIRASHILEHFSHTQTADVLREWIRVLKPGGVLKIAVPDFKWIVDQYIAGSAVPIQQYLMGGHTDENDHHGAIFDEEGLTAALEALGLIGVQRWESDALDCSSLPVSLNLMAWKPVELEARHTREDLLAVQSQEEAPVAPEPVHPLIASHPDARFAGLEIAPSAISAVMTVPRVGFTSFMACATEALGLLGIPLRMSGGVFWNQGLERVFEVELAAGTPYILALDFDTVFDWRDIQTLYGLLEARPDIDAVCAVQMRREMTVPLITVMGPDGQNVNRIDMADLAKDVLPVSTGHFGLTLIRTSSLADLPKPWFHEQADTDGGWGDGRTDADIAFWRQFAAAGKKLYQANRVVAGHLELMCTWPGPDLTPRYQYTSQYHAGGKPGDIWK